MRFEGVRALVTGGSRGIGKAISEGLAAGGARVAVHYRSDHETALATLAGLEGEGHCVIAAPLEDVSSPERLMSAAVDELGGLDVLVNNAGIYVAHPIAEVGDDDWTRAWRETLEVNLIAPSRLCRAAARIMIEQGRGGRIINISSRGAFRGEPEAPAYGASKAALNAMSQSLALALGRHNIGVAVVAPGFVDTDMAAAALSGPRGEDIRAQSPMNRVATPAEVARAALFLAEADSIFLTGGIIDVNGASYLRG